MTETRSVLKTINKKTADSIMKNRTQKLIAIAACLVGATALTAHAGFVTWTTPNPTLGGLPIIVDYSVSETAGVWTYDYQLDNTSHGAIYGITIDDGATPSALTVSSPAGVTGSAGVGSVTWLFATPAGGLDPLLPGATSGILKITTTEKPGLYGGSSFDESAGPWFPASSASYVPAPVPEPTTLVAGALLLLPFGASAVRIVRKNRTA
jgi:hypothetical protein